MVRAKFKCDNKTESGEGFTLEFSAITNEKRSDGQYDEPEENKVFFKYTPWGQLKMGTINPDAAAQFTIGKSYYLDFTPADE